MFLLVDRGWCQRQAAQDGAGRPVYPTEERAVRWCLEGALVRASHEVGGAHDIALALLVMSDFLRPFEEVAGNDTPGRTPDQVAGLLREAARVAESRSL